MQLRHCSVHAAIIARHVVFKARTVGILDASSDLAPFRLDVSVDMFSRGNTRATSIPSAFSAPLISASWASIVCTSVLEFH